MNIIRKSFHIWWKKPQSSSERDEERTISFLELFYDLVYVAIIAELGHALSVDMSLEGLLGFIFLFILVWWAWFNGVSYHELHANNDLRTRIFTFLQMIALVCMAIFAHNALTEGSFGFGISFGVFIFIVAFLWKRTGDFIPGHDKLSRPFSLTLFATGALFIASVFFEPEQRILIWVAAIAISILLPILMQVYIRNDKESLNALQDSLRVTKSIAERFGLLNIIVVGEIIISVVRGASHYKSIDLEIIIIAILSMIIAIIIWWLYFDLISRSLPKKDNKNNLTWVYAHIPLLVSIVVAGASILNIVEHIGKEIPYMVQVFLLGSMAILFASLVLIIKTLRHRSEFSKNQRKFLLKILLGTIPIFLIATTISWGIVRLLVFIIIVSMLPIIGGFWRWVNHELKLEAEKGQGE